jgi:hypothetical protein
MDVIGHVRQDASADLEAKREMSNMDMGEEEAIRKVEAANTPDQAAQSGVRDVEAVTLTWTKTSLACAFVWYVTLPYLYPYDEALSNPEEHYMFYHEL